MMRRRRVALVVARTARTCPTTRAARAAGDARTGSHDIQDRGAVTAELAVGMVAVAAVLAAVLATGAATLTRLSCLDAARTGARVAALGESDGEVVAAARHVLGARDGDVRVARDDGWVTVTVSTPFTAWPAASARARASATSWAEP
ncbi:TadE family type IV pilus minor pilin [Cellulomonas xiejunii]|uniref:TadE family type IV pilus minor pilin n=1 Tax=Cellulomonas xiejunii TaxID=2968083 RepID=UPI001D0E9B2B|nr:TadE family type IV pilus minor pilin [Cellulomonas xiejunii]MCC2315447.1 TadE family protein [Cellulomonas xiejunii]